MSPKLTGILIAVFVILGAVVVGLVWKRFRDHQSRISVATNNIFVTLTQEITGREHIRLEYIEAESLGYSWIRVDLNNTFTPNGRDLRDSPLGWIRFNWEKGRIVVWYDESERTTALEVLPQASFFKRTAPKGKVAYFESEAFIRGMAVYLLRADRWIYDRTHIARR